MASYVRLSDAPRETHGVVPTFTLRSNGKVKVCIPLTCSKGEYISFPYGEDLKMMGMKAAAISAIATRVSREQWDALKNLTMKIQVVGWKNSDDLVVDLTFLDTKAGRTYYLAPCGSGELTLHGFTGTPPDLREGFESGLFSVAYTGISVGEFRRDGASCVCLSNRSAIHQITHEDASMIGEVIRSQVRKTTFRPSLSSAAAASGSKGAAKEDVEATSS